ncbi:MAG: Glu-tRNA(Gln) amidotransferase subunit GatE [Candidatus Micrarchaeia archaeon]
MAAKNEPYYKNLGFMCGLEIHQRLATKEKLFCSCDASLKEDEPAGEVVRRQRAVAGELGKIDAATQFESGKNRKFVYKLYRHETCLVDIDEEPPHDLNKEALNIALQIAAEFHAKVPDELETMRKVVVDGSDPSAFQRTILIGYDGYLEINGKKIDVPSIFLEEESSGIEQSDKETVVYNVNRLGIPLVEIDTAPQISTPQEARDVAKQIGLLLRLTGKVQRGIGSIRQDVNVSIKNGARVEIKGFQDLDSMPEIIEKEIERQLNLIKIKEKLAKNKASVDEVKNISELFANTNVMLIKRALELNGIVLGFRLEGFKGALGQEINPDRRLGTEISEYAKLAGVGGIIHSDENLEHYGFSKEEIDAIRKELRIQADDAFVLIAGSPEMCRKAAELAMQRAEAAIHEIPKETRGADSKLLTTKFLRPLPGGSRMYPETDIRPIEVDAKAYESLLKNVISIDKMKKELEKEIENKELAEQMLWSPLLSLYNEIMNKTGVEGYIVAPIILEKFTELKRAGVDIEAISTDAILAVFEEYKAKAITKAGIEELLKHAPKSRNEVYALIRSLNLQRITGNQLEALVEKYKAQESKPEDIIKRIMSDYRLNIDGNELNALLKGKK